MCKIIIKRNLNQFLSRFSHQTKSSRLYLTSSFYFQSRSSSQCLFRRLFRFQRLLLSCSLLSNLSYLQHYLQHFSQHQKSKYREQQ